MSTPIRFGTGKAAMAWLMDPDANPIKPSGKTGAQLDAEIERELAGPLSPSSARPLPPFPAGRRGASVRRPRVAKAATPRASRSQGSMTPSAFLAALPPARTRQGVDRVSDVDLAKIIRRECTEAESAGALPTGTKISVRILHHKSLKVEIVAWVGEVFVPAYVEHLMDPKGTPWDRNAHWRGRYEPRDRAMDPRLTPALNKALDTIEKIADRHNYNESVDMSDYSNVGYYLTVDARPVEHAAQTGIELESNKDFAALMERGRAAAHALGPAATKSICGNKSLASASQHCLERLIKVADRAGGKPVFFDKKRGGWFPI